MKKTTFIMGALWLAMLFVPAAVQAQEEKLLAFPGAEGFGRYATGGRGGEIYHVTNLNDDGPGSLRDAVSQSNRIVVFDTSGVIKLKSGLVFKGNLTVLGQTAPGEGIQVYGNRVSFSGANNLIVRHMRFRMGKGGDSGKDACGIANGHDMIFDHISALWGRDECFSINWDNKGSEPTDITIQNSIMGQGLQSHACGGLMQTNGGVTLYRNLYIENKTRNPKVKGLNQFVNNVVYNWGGGGCYIMGDTEASSWAHIENNYFVTGPWKGSKPFTRGKAAFQFYGAGNYYDNNNDGELNGTLYTEDGGSTRVNNLNSFTNIPKPHPEISNLMTAEEALYWIIDSVGPCLPARDEVDQYLIDELKSFGTEGSTNGISSEKELPHGGTGILNKGEKPLDSDNDGIPDEWEDDHNLNKNDASDATQIASNGYANIENYVFTIDRAYPYMKMPTRLEATKQEKFAIELQWQDNAGSNNTVNETAYIVEKSEDNQTFTICAELPADSTTYRAEGLNPNTTYYFRVCATNKEQDLTSDYISISTETIGDPAPPEACTNPTPQNDGSVLPSSEWVTFSWENKTKDYFGTVKYDVYCGLYPEPEKMEKLASNLTQKRYVWWITNTSDFYEDFPCYWRVDATNDAGTTTGPVWKFTPQSTLFIEKYPDMENISYMDGTKLEFTLNENAKYNGGIELSPCKYEEMNVTVSGKTLTLTFNALNVLTEYTVTIPEGALTVDSKTFAEKITFTTRDFGNPKEEGETHYGKAAINQPLDFSPFDDYTHFTRTDGNQQSKKDDYPHWITGTATKDDATLTKTSDKIMAYFEDVALAIDVKAAYNGTGNVDFKIQETRNPDVTDAPTWRTIRVLHADDFPFDDIIRLNEESRFIKLTATELGGGTVTVSQLKISDSEGNGVRPLKLEKEIIPTGITPDTAETHTSLKEFTLSFRENEGSIRTTETAAATLTNGETSYPVTLTDGDDNTIVAILEEIVTAAGEYTLTIPECSFGESIFIANPEIGRCNPALSYTFTIEEVDALDENIADNMTVTVANGTVTVSGVPAGEQVDVIDLSGRIIASQKAADGKATFSLQRGFYLLKTTTRTFKVSI